MDRRLVALVGVILIVMVTAACSGQPWVTKSADSGSTSAGSTVSAGGPAPAATAGAGRPAEAARPAPAPPQTAAGRTDEASLRNSGAAAVKPGAVATAAASPPRPAPAPAPLVPPPGQAADPATVPVPSIGRMVIFNTEIGILVRDLGQAVSAMGDIVTQVGGFVAGVEHKEDGGQPLAVVKLKVPPDRYEPTMKQLRSLAVEVTDEKATTQDVTEEFNDLQTQLIALEASHAQLVELMARAQNVEEILKIQEKLAQTKVQIDRIKGRMTFLNRNSELATISVRARPAEDVLARNWTALRAQLRKLEGQRATTSLAIKRAKSAEEEAAQRDKLAELTVDIDRAGDRLKDIETKATNVGIVLPVAQTDDLPTASAAPDQEMAREYLTLRGQLRWAQVEQDRLTREIRQRTAVMEIDPRERLTTLILEINRLNARIKVVQERAAQLGVTLPTLTPEQEAALAGTPVEDPNRPDPWRAARSAWDASLQALAAVATAVITAVVFLWWAVPLLVLAIFWARRRRAPGPA